MLTPPNIFDIHEEYPSNHNSWRCVTVIFLSVAMFVHTLLNKALRHSE